MMHGTTNIKFSPTCFGQQIRPSSGALFDCVYSFWYNAPTLLPIGATVEMELTFRPNRGTSQQQCRYIVPKAVYTVKKCSLGWENLSPELSAELKN